MVAVHEIGGLKAIWGGLEKVRNWGRMEQSVLVAYGSQEFAVIVSCSGMSSWMPVYLWSSAAAIAKIGERQ